MTPTGRNRLFDLLMMGTQAAGRGEQPEQTGYMLPAARYQNGGVLPAVPGAVTDAMDWMSSGMNQDPQQFNSASPEQRQGYDKQVIQDALNVSMMAGTGSLAATRPANSLGMGGKVASDALDMSHAARMARAKEMGFDTGKTWYHGSPNKFEEFDPSLSDDVGLYFTTDYKTAANYNGPDGVIHEVYLRNNNPYVAYAETDGAGSGKFFSESGEILPFETNDEIASFARGRGHTSMEWPQGNLTEADNTIAVFDPRNIRSVNAAFDPAKKDSANLLASNPIPMPFFPWQEGDN